MASNHPGYTVVIDPAVPVGQAYVVPIKGPDGIEYRTEPPPWSPAYKDWGFDAIYPATPDPFTQIERWDRERRRAGLRPWIEPRPSSVAGLSNVLKSVYSGNSMLHQLNATSTFLWGSREITTGTKMLEDMRRYSATAPHRRALTALKNFRSGWRRQLALRLAPELQEDYSW